MRIQRCCAAAFVALLLWAPQALAQIKIGYINLNSVLQGTEEGRAIVAKLEREFATKKEELQKRMKEFQGKAEQFQRQAQMLKEDVRQQRAKALAMEEQQIQGLLIQAQAEIDKKKGEALNRFEKKLRGVIEAVASREGLDYVLRHEVLLFGPAKMDVTNQVIREYDKRYTGKKGGAKKSK
ncbi:MAG: OmpH family outer membrane protein [Deltaproteobacteria bacterium]|nr:OmpH family outer membrane protein [Deltaproteobacteria bacterium]